MSQAKPRYEYIDLMKGLCIMLIVILHVDHTLYSDRVNAVMQAFRVPLYYFLSGLFFKRYSGIKEFSIRKANNILIPFLFFSVTSLLFIHLTSLLPPFGELQLVGWKFHWHYLWHMFQLNPSEYNVPIWFLISLLWVNLIFYGLHSFLKGWYLAAACLLLGALGWWLASEKIFLPVLLDTSLAGLPFFMLGSIVKSQGAIAPGRYDKYGFIALAAVLVLLYFAAAPIDIHQRRLPDYFRLYALSFAAILALFWSVKSLPKILPVNYFGRHSIIILGSHYTLLAPIRTIFYHHFGETAFSSWATVIVLFGIELAIIPLCKWLFPRFTAQKPLIPVPA